MGEAVIRLLLVDDDRLVLATVSEGLRSRGFDVVTASSGEQALAILEKSVPDMVILDMRMPGMSGVETAQHMRQRVHVPFIFLSAYNDDSIVSQATAEGAMGYLVKPVDVGQIVPAIKAALARARDLEAIRQNEERLQTALNQGRETSMAIGLIMERYHFSRDQAFEALRYHARSQRRKLEEVAVEFLAAAETGSLPAAAVARGLECKSSSAPPSSPTAGQN